MNYCGKHRSMIGNKVKFLGLWGFVKPERTKVSAIEWLEGTQDRERMDPLVIIMLELQAHVDRILAQKSGRSDGRVKTCPLCAVMRLADDEGQDVRSLDGYGMVVLKLFQTNGLVSDRHPAEIPAPKKLPMIIRPGLH